ncbi:hypothetical protein ES703_124513 [subsurface metagenome]
MAKRKYPSEINTRTVRVNLGDWQMLLTLAQTLETTVAEAFHKLITETARLKARSVSKSQLPLPTFSIRSSGTIRVRSLPTIATNGNKSVVFRIQPKGVRYE